MSPIQGLSLTCEAVNAETIVSEGDVLTGTVSLTLSKDTRVNAVFVKVTGDARVRWMFSKTSHNASLRYFKLKKHFVAENDKGTVLSKGVHCFKFTFQIPHRDMPSSFLGYHGYIIYMLVAKVSRSWRRPSTARAKINLVSNSLRHYGQLATRPQARSVEKTLGFCFKEGVVQLHAVINRDVCSPGDKFSVVATVHNMSTKTVRPTFLLYRQTVYNAKGHEKTRHKRLYRMIGNPVAPRSDRTSVTWQSDVPDNAIYTIDNCELISVRYFVKVYLGISCAWDPEVVLPLVVIPANFTHLYGGQVKPPLCQ